ncbi:MULTISPECIES: thioesterase II family protein [Streptomyces]|uniref:thioesterase II family protein n=1 Tax=Streptomyces TaxID=1883 RepID=UPI0004BD5674|nr:MULTISPECIES: alpha/beta fold hydrolase [Streptomyces]
MSRPDSKWFRIFHPSANATARLVCFPHAGASAGSYFGLSAALAPEVEVLAVQYPGRQDRWREPLVDDIGLLAAPIAEALGRRSGAALGFFGHSMGALVAFETARRYEATRGLSLRAFFASGRRPPSRYAPGSVHTQGDQALIAHMVSLGGADPALLDNEELQEMILPVVRNDYRATENYRLQPGPRLRSAVTVLVGDSDPLTPVDEAAAWSEHTDGDTEIRVFSGGHFFLDTHEQQVATLVKQRLSSAVPAP